MTTGGGTQDMATGGGGTGGTGGGAGGSGGGGGTGGSGGGGGGGTGGSTGTVTGTIGGNMFGPVKQAWVIGKPDAATTTVVYLFSSAVDCHDAAIKFGVMG